MYTYSHTHTDTHRRIRFLHSSSFADEHLQCLNVLIIFGQQQVASGNQTFVTNTIVIDNNDGKKRNGNDEVCGVLRMATVHQIYVIWCEVFVCVCAPLCSNKQKFRINWMETTTSYFHILILNYKCMTFQCVQSVVLDIQICRKVYRLTIESVRNQSYNLCHSIHLLFPFD